MTEQTATVRTDRLTPGMHIRALTGRLRQKGSFQVGRLSPGAGMIEVLDHEGYSWGFNLASVEWELIDAPYAPMTREEGLSNYIDAEYPVGKFTQEQREQVRKYYTTTT